MDDAIRAAIPAADLNAPERRKRTLYAAFASGDARFDAFKERYRLTPDLTSKQRLALAEAWRPWRSYAVVMLWSSL